MLQNDEALYCGKPHRCFNPKGVMALGLLALT